MAGHSHAKNVAATKAKQDKIKNKRNTIISKKLEVIASKGADPDTNPTLASAIKKARSMGFSKENIEKVLKNATGKHRDDLTLTKVIYDAYWNNIAIIIVVETDKNSRTAPEITFMLSKSGGAVQLPGAVQYLFQEIGLTTINKSKLSLEETKMEEYIIENGCENCHFYTKEDENGNLTELCDIHFPPKEFATLSNQMTDELATFLKDKKDSDGFVEEESFAWIPYSTELIKGDIDTFRKLINDLEEHDDVVGVYHNGNFEEKN